MKTLLIDDDPFALKLLAHQLEQLDCVVLAMCDRAEDALDLLKLQPDSVGLVFCDLQMPGIDGVEFVRHLAQIGYRGGLVLVSGEDERVLHSVMSLAQAHRIHILGGLRKPVSNDRLKQVLVSTSVHANLPSPVVGRRYGEEDLARALTQGELLVHYQPKVDLSTGAPVGVEALVRWQHPRDGLVFPDQFIATAEESGLIGNVTRAVLSGAMSQARRWRDAGLELQVAVNVSMDNLEALDFPDTVTQLARECGVSPSSVVLEVTESRLMKDVRTTLDILTRLRLRRIGLSIDDFGTGHSSLSQLHALPFDELKLDRSFVHGAADDSRRRAIVSGTLTLARQLGMKSVAEGVEDRADWDILRSLGCDVAQGYFIARPMPAADLQDWCRRWEVRRLELVGAST